MDLRSTVAQALKLDTGLHALNIPADMVLLNNSVDSPVPDRFLVLRWGNDIPLFGAQRSPKERELSLWVYDRDQSYEAVRAILARADSVLAGLVGNPTGSGYIIDVRWSGDGADDWDDVYERTYKSATYTIVGSGD
jgi:hypothetical protein